MTPITVHGETLMAVDGPNRIKIWPPEHAEHALARFHRRIEAQIRVDEYAQEKARLGGHRAQWTEPRRGKRNTAANVAQKAPALTIRDMPHTMTKPCRLERCGKPITRRRGQQHFWADKWFCSMDHWYEWRRRKRDA